MITIFIYQMMNHTTKILIDEASYERTDYWAISRLKYKENNLSDAWSCVARSQPPELKGKQREFF